MAGSPAPGPALQEEHADIAISVEALAVSSSVRAMDALRARIRAQSKTVANHIAADPEAQAFIDDWTTLEPISR